jgi:hypothetical protein
MSDHFARGDAAFGSPAKNAGLNEIFARRALGAISWLSRATARIDIGQMRALFAATALVLLSCFASRLAFLSWLGATVDFQRVSFAFAGAAALTALAHWLATRGFARLALIVQILALRQFWSLYALEASSYVFVVSRDVPLADALLARWDAALGFDWPGYVTAFMASDLLAKAGEFAYRSIAWQPPLLMLALVAAGRARRAYVLISSFIVCLAFTTALAPAFPAFGAYEHFAYPHEIPGGFGAQFTEPLTRLRAGDLTTPLGVPLIQFPSFHASCALLFAMTAWGTTLRWPMLALNLMMAAATPVFGSHYLSDMIAGAALMAVTLAACSALLRKAPQIRPFASALRSERPAFNALDALLARMWEHAPRAPAGIDAPPDRRRSAA